MLPPGPAAPAAAQTVEWIARPTALLRRSAARYGEPFTLRTRWADAPMVIVSDPETIKRVYAAPEDVLRGGASSTVLEPFAGPSSILLTSGALHLRQRRLVLPPFHGRRMEEQRAAVAALAAAEVARWTPGEPLRTLPRMQSLTLDVILRVVLGRPDPALRDAIRDALDMASSLARLVTLSLVPRGSAPWRSFLRAVARVDRLLHATIARGGGGGTVLDELIAAGASAGELRDQVVTLLAAGHETTAGSLAWACERLARHPEVAARLREDDDAYLDATVREVLRTRPVLSITARKVVAPFAVDGYELPWGCTSRRACTSPTGAASSGPTRPRSGPSGSSRAPPRRTAGSRSAAAPAAAPAPRSRRWSCTRCCARSCAASRWCRTGRRASGCAAAASRWRRPAVAASCR